MHCHHCEHDNRAGRRFCGKCGGSLAAACPSCGAPDEDGERFCGRCGAELVPATSATPVSAAERTPRDYTPRHLAEKILHSKSALEGERKQVTVLFADVKGSMELAEELDPETWHGILDRFFQLLAGGVHRFEGTVNQYTGDGIMAIFGAPIAHEDHAHRACFAALHLRDAVRAYAAQVREQYGVPFGVRIGLNSGDVVVGRIGDDLRMDYTAQGHTVGLAQRMEALAESGHVCVSEHTAQLVEGYFELDSLGRLKVKGVRDPVATFDLVGVGPYRTRLDRSRARGLSTFVGRDDEMRILEVALEKAHAGQARIVGVVADAGVGKSRLCFEFNERARKQGVAVHEAHCPAHGKAVPHLPVLELLRDYFGITETEDERTVREKIAGRLLLLDREFESALPILWEFMRVPDSERPYEEPDADIRKRELAAVIRRLVRARSERETVVILLDDLHWIDAASDDMLADLVEAVRGTRTLVVVNFRPEYRAAWMQRSDYQQIPLTPLGRDAIRVMLGGLLGADPSVAELPTAIEARTAGNPFFTEEVVSSLIESGALEGSVGKYRLVGSLQRLEIPPTVHAVLAARIDRLAAREKELLQTAAIIGNDFTVPVLAEIVDVDDLDAALRALCETDFLFERTLYPVAEYAFRHPLTHEVAYASQLHERRRGLHAALARVLESDDVAPALLAYHWDEAGETELAARWHRKAAQAAVVVDMNVSIRHWERVCELIAELPETQEHLATAASARGQILWLEARRGTSPERARKIYDEAMRLAERADDVYSLARGRCSYAIFRLYAAEPGAYPLAQQGFRDAQRSGDRPMQIAAHWTLGAIAYFSGDLVASSEYTEAGIALCGDDLEVGSELLGWSPWVMYRGVQAAVCALRGHPRDAVSLLTEALADHGERHRFIQAIVAGFRADIERVAGDPRSAAAAGRRSVEVLEQGSAPPGPLVWAYSKLGSALALAEDWDDAEQALEHAISLSREAGTFLHMGTESHASLANVALARGDFDRARRELDASIEVAERAELPSASVTGHVIRARLLRMEGAATSAVEAELLAAMRLAQDIGLAGVVPEIHRERAALFDRDGRGDDRRRELECAGNLYRAMGAEQNVRRIETEISRPSSGQ